MSYLICGQIIFSKELDRKNEEKIIWTILNQAVDEKIYITFDGNIAQKIVFEILEQVGKPINKLYLPFLITESPILNTSDSLISPYEISDTEEDFLKSLKVNLKKIENFIGHILVDENIDSLVLVFSLGFDNNYKEIKANMSNFFDNMYQACINENDIPSIKILITK